MILSTLWTELHASRAIYLLCLLDITAKSYYFSDSLLKGYMIKTKGFGSYVHSCCFSKVVQQQSQGVVANFTLCLNGDLFCPQRWKNH